MFVVQYLCGKVSKLMQIGINSNINFNGQVNRGILETKQEQVYNAVRDTFRQIMKNSEYDLFVAQERKFPSPNFNEQVKFSLWNPNSRHKLATDYVEVFEHNPDNWIKKLNELIGQNK